VAPGTLFGDLESPVLPGAGKAHPGKPLQAWAVFQAGRTPDRTAQQQSV